MQISMTVSHLPFCHYFSFHFYNYIFKEKKKKASKFGTQACFSSIMIVIITTSSNV